MPLYEYLCRTCAKKIELLVMSGEKPACPHCKGQDLERLLSVFSAPASAGCPADASPGAACGASHKCSSCCHH